MDSINEAMNDFFDYEPTLEEKLDVSKKMMVSFMMTKTGFQDSILNFRWNVEFRFFPFLRNSLFHWSGFHFGYFFPLRPPSDIK